MNTGIYFMYNRKKNDFVNFHINNVWNNGLANNSHATIGYLIFLLWFKMHDSNTSIIGLLYIIIITLENEKEDKIKTKAIKSDKLHKHKQANKQTKRNKNKKKQNKKPSS